MSWVCDKWGKKVNLCLMYLVNCSEKTLNSNSKNKNLHSWWFSFCRTFTLQMSVNDGLTFVSSSVTVKSKYCPPPTTHAPPTSPAARVRSLLTINHHYGWCHHHHHYILPSLLTWLSYGVTVIKVITINHFIVIIIIWCYYPKSSPLTILLMSSLFNAIIKVITINYFIVIIII